MNESINPVELLMEEHRTIEFALQGLLELARQAESGEGAELFDLGFAQQALEFIREFADKHHHGKEEKLLFAMMEKRGFARTSGPLAVMYHEHELGRGLVRNAAGAIEQVGSRKLSSTELGNFAAQARQFASLLMAHIQKEDRILYPMALKYLSEEDVSELSRQFDEFEVEAERAGIQENYSAIAAKLGMLGASCGADMESGCSACGGGCG